MALYPAEVTGLPKPQPPTAPSPNLQGFLSFDLASLKGTDLCNWAIHCDSRRSPAPT